MLAILSSWPLLTAAFLKIQIPITSNSASVFSVHVMKADTCQLMPFFPNHSDCVSRNLFGSHFMAQSMTTRYWCFSRLLRILDLALSRLMALSTCAVYWSTRSEDCSMSNSRSFFCPCPYKIAPENVTLNFIKHISHDDQIVSFRLHSYRSCSRHVTELILWIPPCWITSKSRVSVITICKYDPNL